jgi:pyridoxamine-phosphate oxidase
MTTDIRELRREYQLAALDGNEVAANPIEQFQKWFAEALESNVFEPNAMTLATSGADNTPSARIVLLKGVSDEGFIFFTNYRSRKGEELAENPRASLLFFWKELERQIRIKGSVSKVSEDVSTEYFQSRPKASQIGAWVSPQSQRVENREWLETRYAELSAQYADIDVLPCPQHWGGYIVKPEKIEFWQGRPSRLHDRILYSLTSENSWKIERLAP